MHGAALRMKAFNLLCLDIGDTLKSEEPDLTFLKPDVQFLNLHLQTLLESCPKSRVGQIPTSVLDVPGAGCAKSMSKASSMHVSS